MMLEAGLPRRFVKHVIRQAPPPSVQEPLEPVITETRSFVKRADLFNTANRSGIQPIDVIIVLGGLIAIFILLVLISGICKVVNRPRSEARHRANPQAMFKPSAAGYGARGIGDTVPLDAPATNLLGAASPMGMGGNSHYGDSSADLSLDTPPRSIKTHTRGKSSGVNFPGPPAAFRRGAQPQHPHLENQTSLDAPIAGPSFSSAAPDGSGFRPGQRFDYGQLSDGLPRGPSGNPNGYAPRQPSLRQGKAANSGPPPALSRSRSGRYAQGSDPTRRSRIDSVGPGTYRKSMFLHEDPSGDLHRVPTNGEGPSSAGGGLRRVESIGKGDARRRSNFMGGGVRGQSIYGNSGAALAPLDIRSAREDGWGSGQRSPGLSTPGAVTPSDMGPLGPRGYGGGAGHEYLDASANGSYPAPSSYSSMQAGYSGIGGSALSSNFPGGQFQAIEGVGSGGGGRRII
ncbi:uncharacterized protein PFL1_05076 [Pseudozyma flocculosa PF-1]|uniref:Uncharacterized protein n=2 Tax=Pseudozyma flocculosa TaxID=84751 RepID=A0A5C3EWQ0_9BASI|nr:uncharacterized protein PFL1_05076 [Pseudozyma flocculosa PF-1]EPQ27538.1 hypothetical protein PFL1_05076 [Pseudozyma flocculosa PF-1]SPO36026.1 uncharacterized protein PSFLO_01497 [Pseudozyma flocculosa]